MWHPPSSQQFDAKFKTVLQQMQREFNTFFFIPIELSRLTGTSQIYAKLFFPKKS